MKTLYEILEVSETASKEIIEKAYRALAKKYHPDLQPPDKKQEAEQKMKQLNEAYCILNDDTKRKNYDEQLKIEREKNTQNNLNNWNKTENYKDFFVTLLILIGIGLLVWYFPITHNYIMDMYQSNVFIKTIIDVIGSIFVGIWNAICSIFSR